MPLPYSSVLSKLPHKLKLAGSFAGYSGPAKGDGQTHAKKSLLLAAIFCLFGFAESIGASRGQSEQVVRTDTVIIAQCDQMAYRHFLLSTLVFSHLIFGRAQNVGDLCLGFVMVDPQIPHDLCICKHFATAFL